jgi:hypothetical protein
VNWKDPTFGGIFPQTKAHEVVAKKNAFLASNASLAFKWWFKIVQP